MFLLKQRQTQEVLLSQYFSFVTILDQWFFRAACVFIGLVSLYDALLVVEYRYGISEENPVCRYLIGLAPETLTFFLAGKFVGTTLVLSILVAISKFRFGWACLIAFALVVFQIGLLFYLQCADFG
ncbi:MAG: hypothetical protein MK106_15660 [Mariniblastus sp.]|nr:hypothetical protein [Mariniblastus sp.]